MTDREPPNHPEPDPGTAPPEEHHGLREEIAHEIAEVVEHVPQPVRWTIGKLVRLIVLSLLALIVLAVVSVALYLANRTELVAREVSLVLNQALAQHSDVVLVIRDIRGNPTSGFRVISPSVRFRDGHLAPLLQAREMQIHYSLWGLVAGNRRSIEVEVDHPVVHLSRGPDGHLRVPRWQGGSGAKAAEEAVRVHLVLRDAEVITPDTSLNVHHANLDAVALTAPARVDVARLDWGRGPYSTHLDRLTAHAELSDSVRIVITDLSSPELALSGRAVWARQGGPRHVDAHVDRVRWPLLARVFDNKTLDVPGEGSGEVHAVGDRMWYGAFRAAVDWDSLVGRGDGAFRFANGELMMTPLHFNSAAGRLDGRLQWAHRGWAIEGNVAGGDPAHWSAIHITGWPSGHLNGWFHYGEDTRPGGAGLLEARLAASDLAGWRGDSTAVRVDFPEAAPDSFTVRLERRGGHMVLHGRTVRDGWNGEYALSHYPLDEWEDGKKSGLAGVLGTGSGTVQSREGGLFVTGDLAGTQTDWVGIHAAHWHLPDLHGRLMPTPDLTSAVRLDDAMYMGVHFDSVAAGLGVGDQRVALDSVRAVAADTTLRLRGQIGFTPQGWTAALDPVRATSSQFDWTSVRPVEFHGDAREVWFDHVDLHDGAATLHFEGEWAQRGGVYDWHGTGRNVDLGRLGLPREWELGGHANADLEVSGRSGNPAWHFTGVASQPSTHGHAADSLALELQGAPARLDVSRFDAWLHGGQLSGRVHVDEMQREWPDTLVADAVLRWIASANHWQGGVEASAVPLDRLSALAPRAEGVTGMIEGRATLSGAPRRPIVQLEANLKPLAWREYRADEIALQAAFSDLELQVPDLRVTRAGIGSRISGHMPLDLALDRAPVVPDQPMHWTIEAKSGDLAVLAPFIPQIGFASGRFDVAANVDGTPHHPSIEGLADVRDARVRLAAREEQLEAVRADFRIHPSEILLDSLTAKQGQHGRVRATGRVALNGFALRSYSFDLSLRDFAASEPGLYAALFDGDFKVTNGVRVNGQTLPMVDGRARIDRAAILFDFSNQSEMQQIASATQPLFWTYRIQLVADNHLNWRPPEGDIEFDADLRMEQTRDSLIIFGEMHAIRGTYWYLSNKFAVQNADLTFDNVEGANPQIDASATTRVKPAYAQDGLPNDPAHEITVHIKGRANKPTIEFTDAGNPPWDQSAILREITVPEFATLGAQPGAAIGNPLDNYLTRAINRSLSADLSAAFGGYINEWSVDRDQGGLLTGSGDVVMTAGSQITNQLSLRYSQRLPGFGREGSGVTPALDTYLFEREVQAEYRLNRFIYLTTDISQRRTPPTPTTPVSSGPDYNVNLKARWEY